MDLTLHTFIFCIVLSLVVVGFGIGIFFKSDNPNKKMGSFGLVTMILGLWLTAHKSPADTRVLVQSEV